MSVQEVERMSSSAQLYQYSVDPAATNTAAAQVMRFTGTEKTVLELGAGPGSITRSLVEVSHNRLSALEYDAESVEILKGFCEFACRADLNDSRWPELVHGKRFDVIVAADVLEHLYDPWGTLRLATSLLNDGGSIVVSLPHAAHAGILGTLMANDFQYRGLGLLDRTHIRFFAIRNIQALIEEAGLIIADYAFVIRRPEECEFAETWATLPPETRAVLEAGDFSYVYQVVVRALPMTQRPAMAGYNLLECADNRTSAPRTPPAKPWWRRFLRLAQ
jgi:2-polyprenyl-3-methyl-5-hydroxy-6-metoxy-1,4-benzoquinol methylase